MISCIALSAVGVEREAVVEDYAISTRYMDEWLRRKIADGGRVGEFLQSANQNSLRSFMASGPEIMEKTLEYIESNYGSAPDYVRVLQNGDNILEGLAHDRVSIQYEMMRDLMNGGVSDSYVLYDIDRLKTLNVSLISARDVKVPAGTFTVIGVRHQAEGSSRITTLWCAEELDYLPVIIEQHRKGKLRLRATLSRYTPEST